MDRLAGGDCHYVISFISCSWCVRWCFHFNLLQGFCKTPSWLPCMPLQKPTIDVTSAHQTLLSVPRRNKGHKQYVWQWWLPVWAGRTRKDISATFYQFGSQRGRQMNELIKAQLAESPQQYWHKKMSFSNRGWLTIIFLFLPLHFKRTGFFARLSVLWRN